MAGLGQTSLAVAGTIGRKIILTSHRLHSGPYSPGCSSAAPMMGA
jgi:hypothetical protein